MARQGEAGRSWQGMARRGVAWRSRLGAARRVLEWRGGRGKVRRGRAGRGSDRQGGQGKAWRGLAGHGGARRSTSTERRMEVAFKAKDRQRIIDNYLAGTGRNMFIPHEFIDWLSDQPEHEVYDAFFGTSDEHAARQHRIALARRMASGLRIVAHDSTTESTVIGVTTREYPAYVSPMAGRKGGGGYEPVDPLDASQLDELRRQGATALRGWLARYRGAFEQAGVDLSGIEEIAASEDSSVALSA